MAPEAELSELLAMQGRWSAPVELAGPVPRPVQPTGWGKAVRVIAGVFVVMGMLMTATVLVLWIWWLIQTRGLEREGVTANAEIVNKREAGGQQGATRYLLYRFEAGGRSYQREIEVPVGTYQRVELGDHITVRYAAAAPGRSFTLQELEPEPFWPALLMPPFLYGFWRLITWQLRLQQEMLEWGQPAPALVTDVYSVKGGKKARYKFLDSAGAVVKGSAVVSRSKAPRVGDAVTVLYDARRPGRSTIYPAHLAKIALPEIRAS